MSDIPIAEWHRQMRALFDMAAPTADGDRFSADLRRFEEAVRRDARAQMRPFEAIDRLLETIEDGSVIGPDR